MSESYKVTLEEAENGDLILPLPKELFEGDQPWFEDDELEWSIRADEAIVMTNVSWKKRTGQV